MDWAKYTDEGWYGDAAIRHYQRGHWYVAGDFNPAAALPVWPLVELIVFRFTGVSLTAARGLTVGIFGLILLASFLLLRRWQTSPGMLAPATAVLLLAVSPFCFVFTRLAILEPLLVLLALLALLAASAAGLSPANLKTAKQTRRVFPKLALGLLLPLMILTKNDRRLPLSRHRLAPLCRDRLSDFPLSSVPLCPRQPSRPCCGSAISPSSSVLTSSQTTAISSPPTPTPASPLATAATVLHATLKDGFWIGSFLYPCIAIAAIHHHTPRIPSPDKRACSSLSCSGLRATRHFSPITTTFSPGTTWSLPIPLTLIIPLGCAGAAQPVRHTLRRPFVSSAITLATIVILSIALPDAFQTLHYARTPEYTFARAADQVRRIVKANPEHSPLVLSISGSDLSLMTGLPSICDDFGTMELADRVAAYRPGWYLAWNQVDDDKMEALAPLFRLQRVAAFPAMDDPERNLLILYRLDPADSAPPPHKRRKPIPRLLQTRLGQQPSEIQLVH